MSKKVIPQNCLSVSRHVKIAWLTIVQLIIMLTLLHSLLEILVTTSNSGQFIKDRGKIKGSVY